MKRALAAALVAATSLSAPTAFAQTKAGEETETPNPEAAPTKEGPEEAIPAEENLVRYPPSSVRLPLIIGGSFVTLAAYGITLAAAYSWDDVPGADAMKIPVAGPWVALAQNDCAADDPDCGAILWVRGILLVVDGIAQLGGLGLIAEGIFMTTEADAPASDTPKTSWSVAPIVTPTQTGFGVVGTF